MVPRPKPVGLSFPEAFCEAFRRLAEDVAEDGWNTATGGRRRKNQRPKPPPATKEDATANGRTVQWTCPLCTTTHHNASRLTCRRPGCPGTKPTVVPAEPAKVPVATRKRPCWECGALDHIKANCPIFAARVAAEQVKAEKAEVVGTVERTPSAPVLQVPAQTGTELEPTVNAPTRSPTRTELQAARNACHSAGLLTEAAAIDAKLALIPAPAAPSKLSHNRLREVNKAKDLRERELAMITTQLKDMEERRDNLAKDIISKADEANKAREALDAAKKECINVAAEIASEANAEAHKAGILTQPKVDDVENLQALIAGAEAKQPTDAEEEQYKEYMAQRSEATDLEEPMNIDKYRMAMLLKALKMHISHNSAGVTPTTSKASATGTNPTQAHKRTNREAFEAATQSPADMSDEASSQVQALDLQMSKASGFKMTPSPPRRAASMGSMASRIMHTYRAQPY